MSKTQQDSTQENSTVKIKIKKPKKTPVEKQTETVPLSDPLIITPEIADELEKNNSINFTEEDFENSQETEENQAKDVSLSLYKKIAYGFLLATFLLIVVIFYFSFAKLKIKIETDQEIFTNNFILDVYDEEKYTTPEKSDSILGVVKKINLSETKEYPTSGRKILKSEVTGKAIIYNHYNKNQPLVASTRLLSPSNQLYRLKKTVDVPAGGSIEVEIYADKSEESMAIGPSHFIFPGLWSGLQDKIYAENKTSFQYKEEIKKSITADDLANAKLDIKNALIEKTKTEVGQDYANYGQVIYDILEDTISYQADGKIGEDKEKINLTALAEVVITAFSQEQAEKIALKKTMDTLPDDKKIIDLNKNDLVFSLSNLDYEHGITSLNGSVKANIKFSKFDQIIDKTKIAGKDKKTIDTYLTSLPNIKNYSLSFFPPFTTKAPMLSDQIEISVK